MKLDGKAAIVTGGGTGVGRATALQLADRGCSVVVNYSKSKSDAERTAADVCERGVRGIAVQADVADDADCRRMAKVAVSELGRLDVLVNNAGTTTFIQHADMDRVTDDDWSRIMRVNVQGPFQVARAAREALCGGDGGEIVNVSSVAGISATGSSIPYCASKAALNNLTIALARVFAPTVRVNCIAPGFITGRWLQSGLGAGYEAIKQMMEGRAVLGKVCDPEDVADAIVSILTGSDLVTGQVLCVDGGRAVGGPI